MTLKIAQLGQSVLRKRADEIDQRAILSEEFQQFINEMLTTATDSRGVGLAGPQVFRSQRIFVAHVLPVPSQEEQFEWEVFINPKLTPTSKKIKYRWEGCLSFQELMVMVPRFESVTVEYTNRAGESKTLELTDFPARVVQHENDHLDGVLTIDRAPATKYIVKTSEMEAVREELGGN
ncbi:MAG: peptide deformylase [Gemmataceae bacterium]